MVANTDYLFRQFNIGKEPIDLYNNSVEYYTKSQIDRAYKDWQIIKYASMSTDEDKNNVIKLFIEGSSTKKIAKELSLTKATVTKYYQEWRKEVSAEKERLLNGEGTLVDVNGDLVRIVNKEESEQEKSEQEDKQVGASELALLLRDHFNKGNDTEYKPYTITKEEDKPERPINEDVSTHDVRRDMNFKRGDIVLVSDEAYDIYGGIQGTSRPAIIISNDDGNESSINVTVCYMTCQIKRTDLRTHFIINGHDKVRTSMVLGEQIQTVSKRYIHRLDRLDSQYKEKLNRAIMVSLELDKYMDEIIDKEVKRRTQAKIDSDMHTAFLENNKLKEQVRAEIEQEVRESVTKELKAQIEADLKANYESEIASLEKEIRLLENMSSASRAEEVKESSNICTGQLLKAIALKGKHYEYAIGNENILISHGKEQLNLDKNEIDRFIAELKDLKQFL